VGSLAVYDEEDVTTNGIPLPDWTKATSFQGTVLFNVGSGMKSSRLATTQSS